MTETVTFNGHVLTDYWQVASVLRPPAGRENSTTDVSGMDGALITGSVMSHATITVTLLMSGMNATERRTAIRQLMGMVHTDEPKRLQFATDNGLYYMAILDGEVPFTEHVRSGLVELNFVTERPVLYGATKSATRSSGTPLSITVGGTYKTRPTIEASSARATSSAVGTWGVRLDSADVMTVAAPTSNVPIKIDCESREVLVNNTLKMLTPDSDWFELEPGQHTIDLNTGTGSFTVTWQEMWV